MATQNYLLNQPFNTLSIDELNAQDSNAWTWTGRTLVGYVSADNYDNIIPVGSEFVHGEQTGELQGVWELNKLQLSVFIENAGPDSYVEVSAATLERISNDNNLKDHPGCNSRPLTDYREITSKIVRNNEVIDFWYASELTCNIHVGDNHIISCVCWDNVIDKNNYKTNLHYDSNISTYTCGAAISGARKGAITDKTLSVILLEGGVMTYSDNKFTLNQTHPLL